MLAVLCRPLLRPSLLLRVCFATQRAQRLQTPAEACKSSASSTQRVSPPAAAATAAADAGLPAGAATTAAGMVQTRAATAAQVAEQCRLERVVSNLQASCSRAPTAPPVRNGGLGVGQAGSGLQPVAAVTSRTACLRSMAGRWIPCLLPTAQVSSKFAAVLVPLFEDPASGEVHVVLNQRSRKLKTHSGGRAGGWGLRCGVACLQGGCGSRRQLWHGTIHENQGCWQFCP